MVDHVFLQPQSNIFRGFLQECLNVILPALPHGIDLLMNLQPSKSQDHQVSSSQNCRIHPCCEERSHLTQQAVTFHNGLPMATMLPGHLQQHRLSVHDVGRTI